VLVRLVGMGALVAAGVLIAYDLTSGASYSDGPVPSVRDALSCDGHVYVTRQAPRNEPALWRSTPESALETGMLLGEQWGLDPSALRIASRKTGRVLFVYDVSGRARFAALVEGGRGDRAEQWRLFSWAMCEPAELSADGADGLGYGVWQDADGQQASTDHVMTLKGAQRCNWQDVSFIEVGRNSTRPEQYVHDPTGQLARRLRTTYAARVRLPADVHDSGWRRGGYALWLQRHGDAAYLVNLADPTDVERWPRATQLITCA
jgi:hypothetical protein